MSSKYVSISDNVVVPHSPTSDHTLSPIQAQSGALLPLQPKSTTTGTGHAHLSTATGHPIEICEQGDHSAVQAAFVQSINQDGGSPAKGRSQRGLQQQLPGQRLAPAMQISLPPVQARSTVSFSG
eukprot:gene25867-34456_t